MQLRSIVECRNGMILNKDEVDVVFGVELQKKKEKLDKQSLV
jgi:hypothetical protein